MAEPLVGIPDANAALRWLLPYRDFSTQAQALMTDYLSGRVRLLAPYHFRAEVGGGLRRAIAGRSISYREGTERFQLFLAAGIPLHDIPDLDSSAFENCQRYSISFKDSLYVTLAQFTRAPLITTDENLLRAIARFPYKLFLRDYALSPH